MSGIKTHEMSVTRRRFLRQVIMGAAMGFSGVFPWGAFARGRDADVVLTLLHTNDQHSRIEPFPKDGTRYAGLGGFAQRASLLKRLRQQTEHVLLLDAGDVFQGTPYFNLFEGEVEIAGMNAMGYDACTIGNHDFDAGIEVLAERMRQSQFAWLNCNYRIDDTPLEGLVKRYIITERGPLKIGITGVGIDPEGLVPAHLCVGVRYDDPIASLDEVAGQLKREEKCHLVVVLSHLGYRYRRGDRISDVTLAKESRYIDLIIGGHTHTFMDDIDIVQNRCGQPVYIHQVGWAGIRLGRIDIAFDDKLRLRGVRRAHYCVGA